MTEPWNLKTDDSRQPDSLPTFIIFCEDDVSEPTYFQYFETSKIKVNPIKNQKDKLDNVIKAICYCKEHELISCNEGINYLLNEDIHVWCVFDRDIENEISKITEGNTKFDESIRTANSNGFKVAWSNDSFELWILMHFEDIDIKDEKYKNRDTYYKRLTEIFKAFSNPNEDLAKAIKHPTFCYQKDLKKQNNFISIVRNEIIKRTPVAIKRAKKIEEHFNSLRIAYSKKVPCTLVHHLVEELIQFGGKEFKEH